MQTEKKAWHAKSLSFELKVQLLKEQKQSIVQVSKTHEKTFLEKIQNLEKQIQLTIAKKKKVKQKEAKDKHDVEWLNGKH